VQRSPLKQGDREYENTTQKKGSIGHPVSPDREGMQGRTSGKILNARGLLIYSDMEEKESRREERSRDARGVKKNL